MQHVVQYFALKWDKMAPNTALLTQSRFIIKHFSSKKDLFLPIFASFFFLKQGHPLNLPCMLCATLLPFMTTSCLLQIKSGCFDSTDMFIARCNIFIWFVLS